MAVIRNKNSQVKEKLPDASALQYGELTVNCHTESPAVHFKDTAGKIVSLTPAVSANDGAIKISALENGGIIATGDDASANQAVETNKVLSVDTTWLNTWINTNIDGAGSIPGNGDIEINGGDGITASGDNAKANQSTKTTRTLAVDTSWLKTWIIGNIDGAGSVVNDGAIEINGGDGIATSGDNATANQKDKTTRTLAVDSTVIRTTGDQSMADTKTFSGMIGLTNKSVIQIEALPSLPED